MSDASPIEALVADPIVEFEWSYDIERHLLGRHGVELVVPDDPTATRSALARADVVLVSRRLTAEQIAALRRCVGIVCYAVGIDGVDADAAASAGIPVRSVPDYCCDEVADHALALLLAAERRLMIFAGYGARGDWNVRRVADFGAIRRLSGKTLGIVGAGQIGRRVASRARAFGFRTLAYDPFVDATLDDRLELVSLAELLAESDAIILCAALTPASRGLLNHDTLALVRRGVVLVNVARGGLIDEPALVEALREGRVAVAALDVRASEPPPADDPFLGLPNVILTQHLGSISRESTRDLHEGAVAAALDLLVAAGRVLP